MLDHDLRFVRVDKEVFSKHAKRGYKISPQLFFMDEIDLRGVFTMEEFFELWETHIGEYGDFTLFTRDKNGHWRGKIAKISVSENGIKFKDNRCALAVMMRNSSKRFEEEDIVI